MPLYTFYPCNAAGESLTFVTEDLSDDTVALSRALAIGEEHPSCTHVVAWAGDRKVLTRNRAAPEPARRA